MDEKGEYLPLENTSSPPHAGQSPPDTGDVSTEISVNYGKSFHLRFAGNSTVRKERPKLRKKREDGDDDSTDDEDEEEDVVTTAEVQSAAAATESAPTDSQELRLKLSQRIHQDSINMPPPTTERLHIPNVLMDMLSEDTNKDSVNIPETTTEGLQHQETALVETGSAEQSRNGIQEEHESTTPAQISVEVEDAQQEEDNTRGESTNTDSDPDSFRFYSPESEPFIPPDVQNRAKEVLEELILDQKNGSSITDSCCGQCCDVIQPRRFPGDNLIPPFTPLLQRASNQGLKLMALFVNPSLPRAFRDGWVLIELAVTIYQFVLSCVSLAENHTEAFNIVYVTLASIALLLSLVDVLVHCVQLGSLASLYLYIRSKFNTRYQPARQSGPESVQSCCLLGEERRQRINKSLDLIRNIVSELVLYPLLICDMFDFIATGSYGRADSGEKINFSLFIVGAFYLVLSVYLARMLMIAFSLFSLRRIPRSSSHTQQTYVNLMIKFGIHVLGQLILSIVLIAAIGVKIRQENPNSCSNGNCVTASGYLIYAIIAGGLLPLLGIFSFFATNVYKIRIMSVSLWVDMVSLLQSESFTSVVFAKEGIHKAKEAAQNFAQKVQLVEVRKQLKGVINSMPSWAKRLYPLRFPAFWAFGIFYTLLLASFLVTLFLSEPEENFSTDFFEENLGLVAIVAGILLAMANIHILFLTGVLVSFMVVLVLLFLLSPVLFVVGVVFYLPLGCLFGCLEYFRSLAGEMSVFSKPAEHKSRIRSAIQQTRAELRK